MTTIAFDGRILAADTAGNWDGVIRAGTEKKIVVGNNFLGALVGRAADAMALMGWADGLSRQADLPKGLDPDIGVLLIDRGRAPELLLHHGHSSTAPVPFANGSGREIALGAMYAGATAVEAVRIACELDPNTRGPIHYVIVAADPWIIRQAPEKNTVAVRHDGDVPEGVRPNGSANGGSAPHPQHEGHP